MIEVEYNAHIRWYENVIDCSWYHGDGWYFWNETQTFAYGPYPTIAIAKEKMKEYAKTI